MNKAHPLYEKGFTENNVLYERYGEKAINSRSIVCIVLGSHIEIGSVKSKTDAFDKLINNEDADDAYAQLDSSCYLGGFAFRLSRATNMTVYVIYQPAISSNLSDCRGVYNHHTNRFIIDAIGELAQSKKVYPIFHSFGATVGIMLMGDSKRQFYNGTFLAPFTNLRETLSDRTGKLKRVFCVSWYSIYRISNWLNQNILNNIEKTFPTLKSLKTVPVNAISYYENKHTTNKYWHLSHLNHLDSAKYAIEFDLEKELSKRKPTTDISPLFVIGQDDQIINPMTVERIAHNLKDNSRENFALLPDTTHQIFMSKKREKLIDLISSHLKIVSQNIKNGPALNA